MCRYSARFCFGSAVCLRCSHQRTYHHACLWALALSSPQCLSGAWARLACLVSLVITHNIYGCATASNRCKMESVKYNCTVVYCGVAKLGDSANSGKQEGPQAHALICHHSGISHTQFSKFVQLLTSCSPAYASLGQAQKGIEFQSAHVTTLAILILCWHRESSTCPDVCCSNAL